MEQKNIDLLVRAVIEDEEGKILLCKKVNKDYFFFPGGHVEFGESTEKALRRELREELGVEIESRSFIGGSEHKFIEDGIEYHEINLVFWVIPNRINTHSKENHLKFFLLDKNQLRQEKVLPEVLVKAILGWFENKKTFWVSAI